MKATGLLGGVDLASRFAAFVFYAVFTDRPAGAPWAAARGRPCCFVGRPPGTRLAGFPSTFIFHCISDQLVAAFVGASVVTSADERQLPLLVVILLFS